jgi:RNA polymerase sigma-70 factor, ECF subfamily
MKSRALNQFFDLLRFGSCEGNCNISCNLSGQPRLLSIKDPFSQAGVNSPTDTQLMQSVRGGELKNLALLFERHHVMLYNHYLRTTHDRELSEDLVQEVFYRILKYRHTYRGDGLFTTWLYHIARNVRIDAARRKSQETAYDEELHACPDDTPVRDSFEFKQSVSMLEAALARLPEEKREIIMLSRYQNLKYAAIAEILGCSVDAVKVRVHRAVNDLRKIFLQLSGEPQT